MRKINFQLYSSETKTVNICSADRWTTIFHFGSRDNCIFEWSLVGHLIKFQYNSIPPFAILKIIEEQPRQSTVPTTNVV